MSAHSVMRSASSLMLRATHRNVADQAILIRDYREKRVMNQENIIVICANCGTKNRVPKSRFQDNPICGKCKALINVTGSQTRPFEVTDQTFGREVLDYSGPVLVDCWAPWCGPCRTVAPVLDQLALEYVGQIKIAKLNVDENPVTASKYGIQSIPTMLLFNNGEKIDQLVGALPKQEIERHIKTIL